MYKLTVQTLTGDEHTIYYPGNSSYVLTNIVIKYDIGLAGELRFKMPPSNLCYSEMVQNSIITVYADGEELWRGDIRSIKTTFDKSLEIYCLEDLAWLGEEPVAMSAVTSDIKAQRFASAINSYNANQETIRKFSVGAITIDSSSDSCSWIPTYGMSTLSAIREFIAGEEGYLKVRRVTSGGVTTRYIDIKKISDYGQQSSQTITFGSNLLDYVKNMDATNIVNVLYPYGAETETVLYNDVMSRLVGTSIQDDDSISAFGRHAKTVVFDTDDLTTLNALAAAYLSRYSQPYVELEISAVDLGSILEVDNFKLGDSVRVLAPIYAIDQWFYITSMDVDLLDAAKNQITLSDIVRHISLTDQTTAQAEEIEDIRSPESILNAAKANALNILNGENGGIIYFVSNSDNQIIEQVIANNLDIDQATKAWRWNLNGLAYLHRDYPSDDWTIGVAITMDGQIVADYITTGTLNADLIKAGVISDVAGNFSLDMTTGTLVMQNGTFTGTINSTNGTIGAWTINSNGISASVGSGASMLTPTQIGVTNTNQVSNLATFKTMLDYSYAFLDYGGESSDGTNTWGGFYVAAQGNNNYVLPTLAHTRMSATQFTAYAGTNRYSIVSSTGFDFNQRAVGAAFYSNFSSGDSNITIEGTYSSRLLCFSSGSAWSYSDIGSGQYSDIRLKEDIQDISSEKARAFFNGLRPVEFKFIADSSKRQHYGLIAQDLEQVLEDAEIVNDVIVVEDTSDDHYKQIYSNNYEAFVLKAVKDLYDLVESQQDTINELKAEIERLKS